MFRTDTFFSLVDYILKLILIFKILKRHLLDYLRVKSIPFSKYNPFQTKEWVEHSLVHWKITEKLIYVQTFYWEVGDKNNSKMWSLALQKLPGRWKMAPAPSRLWEFYGGGTNKGHRVLRGVQFQTRGVWGAFREAWHSERTVMVRISQMETGTLKTSKGHNCFVLKLLYTKL